MHDSNLSAPNLGMQPLVSGSRRLIILSVILIIGFMLRSYRLDAPSIGYHNMKENESLSIAQEMLRTGDFINKRLYFDEPFQVEPKVKNNPFPALVSYQVILSWELLGINLWGVRLFNILFGLGAIILIYFLAYALFDNEPSPCTQGLGEMPALGAAALVAIMPVGVFFSRNIQADSPAFFFMVLGSLFYLKFIRTRRNLSLVVAGASFVIAWVYSFNYIFGALPFLFCLPFKEIARNKKVFLKSVFWLILPYAFLGGLLAWWLTKAGGWGDFAFRRLSLDIFSPGYWQKHGKVILWYTSSENFTPVFCILALIGIMLAFFKGSGLINRYIIGWAITAALYAFIFSEELYQQNFVQMPFLGMVVICSVYSISYFAQGLKSFFKKELFIYFLLASIAVSAIFVYSAMRRMHAVAFLGEDVAGESLSEFTRPNERIFLDTYAQGFGIARYAQRYMGWADKLEEFRKRENEFKIRYICFYPSEFARTLQRDNPGLFNYIQDNYHVKEVGFTDEPTRLLYIILEGGRGSASKNFLESFSGPKQLRTIYKIAGKYIFFYTIRMSQPAVKEQ
jgi:4-amino-4-deoxy-L-arabinose transferase-like glycosyltransferase